ncbi:hypothetical protein [Herbaspirillum autotrophicum]|uniref:hypothetical protein n=1 Tax=Herbaspirillum autotrophicum TaxID=180195 RepID=UPI00067C21B2|nr:hypothetical protein [Herbaspirillum autotrophicum]
MKFLSRPLLTALLSLTLLGSAQAAPLMDLLAQDILPMAGQLKGDLHLNPNQQILWQQTEQKTRVIVNQRQRRREQLQGATFDNLAKPDFDLRTLGSAVEAEATLSDSENHQLRELWLTVNDALDDTQRQTARAFIADRMMREESHGSAGKSAGKSDSSSGRQRGSHGMGGGMGSGPTQF